MSTTEETKTQTVAEEDVTEVNKVTLSAEQKKELFAEFLHQQEELLKEVKEKEAETRSKDKENLPPSPKKHKPGNGSKRGGDDMISLAGADSFMYEGDEASHNSETQKNSVEKWLNSHGHKHRDPLVPEDEIEFSLEELNNDDLPNEEVNDKALEGILRSKYKAIMDHTVEKMGDPVVPNIQALVKTTWGKLTLAAATKKKLNEDILIPSNCKPMVTPKLNSEVYIRIQENTQNKDKAMQERQKDIAKATVPVLRAMGHLEGVETVLTRILKTKQGKEGLSSEDKFLYKAVKESLKELTSSLLVSNYAFTETTRKRKYDVCAALGPQFRPHVKVEDTGEFLFGLDTQKAMKSELKTIRAKGANNSFVSKNFRGSGKSPRSFNSGNRGGYRGSNNHHHSSNYNNYHKQNNKGNGNSYNNNNNQNNNQNNSWGKRKKP